MANSKCSSQIGSGLFRVGLTLAALFLALVPLIEARADSKVTYHGRIVRPDGTALEGTVQFKIQIRSPGSENCLLFEETHVEQITNRVFALTIGEGAPGSKT